MDSGGNSSVLLACYDLDTQSWKTSQRSLFPSEKESETTICADSLNGRQLAEFLETWPNAGTMQNGKCYRRPMLGCIICAKDFFLWPTPRVSMKHGATRERAMGRQEQFRLEDWCFRDSLKESGVPNPIWIEWLSGFELQWTDLDV